MGINDIFTVCRVLSDACSEEIYGFRELCLECMVDIVKICGKKLQQEDEETLDDMMARLAAMSRDETIPKRIRFLLDDVVELGNNDWIPCRSQKEIKPQRIDDLREKFMATRYREKSSWHLHSARKDLRDEKTLLKFRRRCLTRRLAAKSKKIYMKRHRHSKKYKQGSFFRTSSLPGGVIKPKMNYRISARTEQEKRKMAVKQKIMEEVEMAVKSMDSSKMEKFAANHPNWRTFLLERLFRKWRSKPYRKTVRKIIKVLRVKAISATELHEAFRRCGITEKEFFGNSIKTGKVAKKQSKQPCQLSVNRPSPTLPNKSRRKSNSLDVGSGDEEK